MKILALHSLMGDDESKKPAVDRWRIYWPLRELKKRTDWQIDEQPTLIPGLEKYKNADQFTQEEMDLAFEKLLDYDIVISSYRPDTAAYTLLKVAADKAGVQYIMDVDDDMFAINPDNPVWMKISDEHCYFMQCMIRDNLWISTTTQTLAKVFRERREGGTVFVNPNYITDDYKHPPFDNGDKIVIGYFGGSSHYADLHETGFLEALRKLMHEDKRVYFKSVGVEIDKYLPKARYEFHEGKRGEPWLKEIFPSLNFDISVAPLLDNIFNRGKSNIKWQESTRAGACFVASRVGPYKDLLGNTAILADNTEESWYKALKKAVDDEDLRRRTVKAAKEELFSNWRLENHWQVWKKMFEKVKEYKDANNTTSK